MLGYKVLNADGAAFHGGSGQWHLPRGSKPGKWMPKIDDIEPCERGYHFCRNESDLLTWLGPTIWVVEASGKIIDCDDKAVAERARLIKPVTAWNDRTARLFACACAKRALKYADPKHVETLRNTIKVAEAFANGKATDGERDAARGAAWDAAWAAVWDAASDAARGAAWAAARAAARDAAGAAAGVAASDAERKWQVRKLKQLLEGA